MWGVRHDWGRVVSMIFFGYKSPIQKRISDASMFLSAVQDSDQIIETLKNYALHSVHRRSAWLGTNSFHDIFDPKTVFEWFMALSAIHEVLCMVMPSSVKDSSQ